MNVLIFDFDGLIVDTETAIYQAWRELFNSQGRDLPLDTYVQCVGSTFVTYDPMADLESQLGRKIDWQPLLEAKDRRIRELHASAETLPGIRELLAEAFEANLPCAVASSSTEDWVEGWLNRLAIREQFDFLCCRNHVPHPKPAPDLFLGVLKHYDVKPGSALVLEDSANGLAAATAAGVPCVIVPNLITAGSDFSTAAGVLLTLNGVSLAALKAMAGTASEKY